VFWISREIFLSVTPLYIIVVAVVVVTAVVIVVVDDELNVII